MNLPIRLLRFLRFAALAAFAASAAARPGDLDISFNPTGKDSPPGLAVAKFPRDLTIMAGLALLPDGKFQAVGTALKFPVGTDVALVRWLPDGSLDPSFGSGGVVRTPLLSQFITQNLLYAMAMQADGKILAAGVLGSHGMILRFLPNGVQDPSFGVQGKVDLNLTAQSSDVFSLAVLSDGKIIAGGRMKEGPAGGFAGARLWRMLADGSPDATFGSTGGVNFPTPEATINDLVVQPDGKILVAGTAPVNGKARGWLARCDAAGALDSSFGVAGIVLAAPLLGGGDSVAAKAALQSDGRIVTAGSGPIGSGIAVFRYDSQGNPDVTFSGGGSVVTKTLLGNEYVKGLSVQWDGKLVVACAAGEEFIVVRYLTNGTLDADFGTGGIVQTFPISFGSEPSALVLQPDGRIVVGGDSWDYISSVGNMVLMRLMDRDLAESLAAEWPAGTVLNDGGTLQWEPVMKGTPPPPEKTITLRNSGATPLTDITATLTGPGASNFTKHSGPATALNGGESTTLTVGVAPGTEASSFAAALVIKTGGADTQEFVIVLRGSTILPVATMALFEGAAPVPEDATVDFGSIVAAQPATRTFTIKNTGNITLLLQGISLGTAGTPGDFAAGPPETEALAAGASTTFPVTFTPRGPGPRTARLRIASTDTFQLPYGINLTGTLLADIDAWRLTHFGTVINEGRAADLSDPDHDGAANLTEYATLTNPVAPEGTTEQFVLSEDTIEYSFMRPSLAPDYLRYDLEWSGSLQGAWVSSGASLTVLSDDGTRQHVKFSVSAGNSSRRFFRLHVERK